MSPTRLCTIEGCTRKYAGQGMCSTHYAAARKSGEIEKLDRSHLHLLTEVDPNARRATCSICGQIDIRRSGAYWMCGTKARETAAKRRQSEETVRYHREYARRNALKTKLTRYQLTPEQWEAMLAECDGRCSICRVKLLTLSEQYVDHDHSCCGGGGSCGACVRAILCRSCNFGIAAFGDRPELMRRGADYLARFAS